jgi:SAM-dependent MidA family methyltransferase
MLELSADLQQRQRAAITARVPHLVERVVWLTQLPDAFSGVAIANEVLDAMPVRRFCVADNGLAEQYVAVSGDGLALVQGPPQDARLATHVAKLDLPAGYASEVNFTAEGWVRSVCGRLCEGLLLLIDYGYPRAEYYHLQRDTGTLRCHYRQQAHDDALRWPGLQDMTAHVDFTAIAEAAHEAGATVAGFATQAQFLINCGLPGLLEAVDPASPDYLDLALQARQLLLPQAMGEAFKVLGLTRGLGDLAPLGFTQGDRRHRL